MSYELHVATLSPVRIALTLQGWLEAGDLAAISAEFLDTCANSECTEVLYDIRSYVGRPSLDTGFRIASALPHWARSISVAFVDDSGWNHYADYMQRLYGEMGFKVSFFASPEEATRWLDQQS
jgi:hypothetical protein